MTSSIYLCLPFFPFLCHFFGLLLSSSPWWQPYCNAIWSSVSHRTACFMFIDADPVICLKSAEHDSIFLNVLPENFSVIRKPFIGDGKQAPWKSAQQLPAIPKNWLHLGCRSCTEMNGHGERMARQWHEWMDMRNLWLGDDMTHVHLQKITYNGRRRSLRIFPYTIHRNSLSVGIWPWFMVSIEFNARFSHSTCQ